LNSFEVIARHYPGTLSLDAICEELPHDLDISLIHHLRLVVQLCELEHLYKVPVISRNFFRALRDMHDLVSL
jgi:hypothetical protein